MSGYPVNRFFYGADLVRLAVDNLVASNHGRRWIDQLSTVIAYIKPSVWSIVPPAYTSTGTHTMVLPYKRSPGCEVLLCEAEVYASSALYSAQLSFGSGWVQLGNRLDGTDSLPAPNAASIPSNVRAFKDATTYTVGAISSLTITKTTVGGNATGIYRAHMIEIPRSVLDPYNSANDPGLNNAWPIPPGKLVESSNTDSTQGSARLWKMMEQGRKDISRHWVIATVQENPWNTTASGGTYADIHTKSIYKIRARRLYTNSTANVYTVFLRYKSNDGFTLRIIATTSAGTVNLDSAYGTSAGVWATDSTKTINLPTDHTTSGEEQEVTIEIQASLNNALKSLDIATVGLIETEA